MRYSGLWAVSAAVAASILLAACDEDGGVSQPLPGNALPVVAAGSDTTVDINGSLFLRASATDEDGSVVSWQWLILLGGDTLVTLDTNIATYRVPLNAGDTLLCVARATDDSGGVGRDTLRAALASWISYPAGGETFVVGDTVTILLRSSYETLGLAFSVGDGEYLLPVPGMSESVIAGVDPPVSFVMPDSIYDNPSQTMVGLVGTCVKLRAFRYMSQTEFVETEGCITVEQLP